MANPKSPRRKPARAPARRCRRKEGEKIERTSQLETANKELANEIAERKRAEAALLISNWRVTEILESIQDGFLALDRDWRFIYINQRAAQNVGYAPEQLIGQNLWEKFPKILGTPHETHYRKAMAERIPARFDISGVLTAPSYDIRVYPSAEGISVYWIDITERRRAEERILNLNAELERRAAQLEAANKELEAFSYSVSHDLRAPLRSISGFGDALSKECAAKLDDQARHYLDRILTNTHYMGELIDDLLTLSRLTRQEMRRQRVDLSVLVRSIVDEHRRREPARQVDVEIAAGVSAHGDAQLLRVALENLLDNAWKFSAPRARARIEFGVTTSGRERVFFVRDNGVGFDMRYIDKLCTPFQRLHKASEFPGAGIGLATAARIVRRHGGRMWADAAVDQGATFYFILGEEA